MDPELSDGVESGKVPPIALVRDPFSLPPEDRLACFGDTRFWLPDGWAF